MRPKGSAKELEVRRLIAGRLFHQGKGVCEVADLVGASSSSVSRWKQALARDGMEGLKSKVHPGRPCRLRREQKEILGQILLNGPEEAGFSTDLWTLKRVAQVIEREFGFQYHPGHVWYILRDMGLSCQKPERRARERNEKAIRRWRRKEWPRIKKKPTSEGGASC